MFKKLFLVILFLLSSLNGFANENAPPAATPQPSPGGAVDLKKRLEGIVREQAEQRQKGAVHPPAQGASRIPQRPNTPPPAPSISSHPPLRPAPLPPQKNTEFQTPDVSPSGVPHDTIGELPGTVSKTKDGHNCLIPPHRAIRILTIDGGGIRGVIPAIVIDALEQELGLPISKIMDAFGGTSAGGIEILAYTKPKFLKNGVVVSDEPAYTAHDVVTLNRQMGTLIFNEKGKIFNILTSGSLYTKTALEEVLETFFGDARISQTVKPVYITTFDLNSESTFIISTVLAKLGHDPKKVSTASKELPIWPSQIQESQSSGIGTPTHVVKGEWPFDLLMVQAARATSAAPLYFPVMSYELESTTGTKLQLIDGGIGNNNPSATVLTEIDKEYCTHTPPAIKLISLGTGVSKYHFSETDYAKIGSPLRMVKPILSGFFKVQEENSNETMKDNVGLRNAFLTAKSDYKRLQVYLPKGQDLLDDASPDAMKIFMDKGREILSMPDFKKIVQSLKVDLCDELVYCRQENIIGKEGLHKKMCPNSKIVCDLKTRRELLQSEKGITVSG